jgi:hypothetical protein
LLYRMGVGWSFLESSSVDSDVLADLPLGIEGTSDYRESGAKLGIGDMVLCYTDGLPESRSASGDFLGQTGLLDIARKVDTSDPARVVPTLLKAIEELYPGNLSADDITVLLFRSSGSGQTTPFLTRAMAPFRLLRAIGGSLIGGAPVPWPDYHPANMGGAVASPLNRLWKSK